MIEARGWGGKQRVVHARCGGLGREQSKGAIVRVWGLRVGLGE